jgi:GNAT superfamily N-acetyltransferase
MAPNPVRVARRSDVSALAALSGELGYPVEVAEMSRRFNAVADRADQAIFVAELDGAVAGWIHIAERRLLEASRQAEIMGLVVQATARGRGLGRALVRAAERWAFMRGLDTVVVRSNIVRPESHPFYVTLGYTRTKTQHVYRKQGSKGGT